MALLTGPSGAGKSTLAALLERRGWKRVDGDALAKSLYVPGSPLLGRLARAFGGGILRRDGSLDTRLLGEIVFSDAEKRSKLRRLVYRPFLGLLRERLDAARVQGGDWVVEVAVYFDVGAPALGLPVFLIQAPLRVRVARLLGLGLDLGRARARARALRFGPAERRASDRVLDGRLPPARLLEAFDRGLGALRGRPVRAGGRP